VFGKALAAGMPLSALVGRADVLGPALERLFYHPTHKSEVYSLAAADAALRIYERDDVPRRIRKTGQRLAAGVGEICRDLGVDGALTGVPYRMAFRFGDPDERRRAHKRTLLAQELAKNGVLTFRGVMLPSTAHGDREIEETLLAFRSALDVVRRASTEESFVSHLEIPLIY